MSTEAESTLLDQMIICGDVCKLEHHFYHRIQRQRQRPARPSEAVRDNVALRKPKAVYKVFGVTELLEKILLYLEPIELLRSRVVRKEFLEVIDGSSQIRIATFRQAEATSDPGRRILPYTNSNILYRIYDSSGSIVITLGELSRRTRQHSYRTLRDYSIPSDMLPVQPPPKSALLSRRCYCDRSCRHRRIIGDSGNNITFGRIYDEIDNLGPCLSCNGVRYWQVIIRHKRLRREEKEVERANCERNHTRCLNSTLIF